MTQKINSVSDEQSKIKNASSTRRSALKKLTIGTAATGAVASLPSSWMKPVVQAIVLPAHASCTECCYPIAIDVVNESDPNPSNNQGVFSLQISAPTAPVAEPVTITGYSTSPDIGDFGVSTPVLPAEIHEFQSLVVLWVSDPGFVANGLPLLDVDIMIDWTCADGTSGTDTLAFIVASAPANQEQKVSTDEVEVSEEEETSPAEEETQPAEEETVSSAEPVEEETPPAEDETPSAEEEPPVEEETPAEEDPPIEEAPATTPAP